MNLLLLAAGILAIVVGLIHSLLGEILIFKNLRSEQLVPTIPAGPLREKHIRILWATWHIPTLLGFCVGAILVSLAGLGPAPSFVPVIVRCIAYAMGVSALLVLVATKARHPGWIGLLGVAALCWFS